MMTDREDKPPRNLRSSFKEILKSFQLDDEVRVPGAYVKLNFWKWPEREPGED